MNTIWRPVSAGMSSRAGLLSRGGAWSNAGLVLSLAGLLFAAVPSAGFAQASPPDVVVSAACSGSPDFSDEVVVSYRAPAPEAQLRRDLASLIAQTGWALSDVRVEAGSRASLSFTTPRVAALETGQLPVAAVVTALRAYPHLAVAFDVLGRFAYTGPTHYSDNNVAIDLQPLSPGSHTYGFQVTVKNAGFQSLQLNTPPAAAPAAPVISPLRLAMALLAAGLIGLAVYLLFLRLNIRSESTPNSYAR